MSKRKSEQLGMNPSTASQRLTKDILWSLVVRTGQDKCFRCGENMTREDFSIEHKEPWMDSDDPIGLYFDLGNVDFSHQRCNYKASRKNKSPCGTNGAYGRGCRCDPCKEAHALYRKRYYDPKSRRNRYEKYERPLQDFG